MNTNTKVGAAVAAALVATTITATVATRDTNSQSPVAVASAAATLNRPSAPTRPSYRDVSLKVIEFANDTAYAWYRGHTASQVERDAMEETLLGVAMPEVFRYQRSLSCQPSRTVDAISNSTGKLGPNYENRSMLGNRSWSVPAFGRHYSKERYALKVARDCSVGSSGATKCAKNPLATPALLDLLNIRIEGGKCVRGALFATVAHAEPYSTERANVGELQARTRMPAVSADPMGLLAATHAAHAASSEARCGGPAATVSVQGAHLALEATATTEEQHHFLRMKDFSGAADPEWTPPEVCAIAREQDKAHARWMQAEIDGNWTEARVADNDHQNWHVILGVHDPDLVLLFSAGAGMGCPAGTRVANCKTMTEAEAMERLAGVDTG